LSGWSSFGLDPLGRLTNALANGSQAASYGFDMVGNLQYMRYGNGVTNLYQYDARNRLTNLVWKLNASPLASFGYQLGPTGTRMSLSESLVYQQSAFNQSYAWSYDFLYRLTKETMSGALNPTLGYGYDAVGNRINRQSTLNQLPSNSSTYTANDWLASDHYDSDGNTTNSSGVVYQYDALDHLTNVNNGTVLIAYDGDGNRVSKTVGGVTTYYLVDDRNPSGYAQVLEEYTSQNSGAPTLQRTFAYGLALVSQTTLSPQPSTTYYGSDGHGSTRFLTDPSGNTTDTFAYDAYGTLIASTGSTPNNYLYCGEQYDPDLGMYYLRARYFNPGTGRFWTADDGDQGDNEDPLSLHLYTYCKANPVNLTDPSGHDGTVMELNISGLMVAGMAAFTGASLYEAKTHAIGNLMVAAWTETRTDAGSLADAAESALSVARTSTRQLIKEAEDVLKQTGRALKKVKVVPVPRSVIPNVANHVAMAQASGKPMLLTRTTPAQALLNREAATRLSPPAGLGKSLDEYPFASSVQGGFGASVVPVPWLENSIQGGIIGACYTIEGITPGTPYWVVVTP